MQGTCVCDPAWSASPNATYSLLDEPITHPFRAIIMRQLHLGVVTLSKRLYHLFVAQMALECGLGQWGSNSAIVS